jgi:hypothetical protein
MKRVLFIILAFISCGTNSKQEAKYELNTLYHLIDNDRREILGIKDSALQKYIYTLGTQSNRLEKEYDSAKVGSREWYLLSDSINENRRMDDIIWKRADTLLKPLLDPINRERDSLKIKYRLIEQEYNLNLDTSDDINFSPYHATQDTLQKL